MRVGECFFWCRPTRVVWTKGRQTIVCACVHIVHWSAKRHSQHIAHLQPHLVCSLYATCYVYCNSLFYPIKTDLDSPASSAIVHFNIQHVENMPVIFNFPLWKNRKALFIELKTNLKLEMIKNRNFIFEGNKYSKNYQYHR